jgi:putative PIN family toxin of toxin-antitoxin system
VVSPQLLDELERALAYPKLRRRVTAGESGRFRLWLESAATVVPDQAPSPSPRVRDPGEAYLVDLASAADAWLVSGDRHLLDVAGAPVRAPAAFLALLEGDAG